MGRDLARLPHGNQEALLETINKHQLNCRETKKIATALQTRPRHEHDGILRQPWELLRPDDQRDIPNDPNLDPLVNELQRKLLNMERHCLAAAFAVSSTEFGQFSEKEELLLINCCKQAMTSLDQVQSELQKTINIKGNPAQ